MWITYLINIWYFSFFLLFFSCNPLYSKLAKESKKLKSYLLCLPPIDSNLKTGITAVNCAPIILPLYRGHRYITLIIFHVSFLLFFDVTLWCLEFRWPLALLQSDLKLYILWIIIFTFLRYKAVVLSETEIDGISCHLSLAALHLIACQNFPVWKTTSLNVLHYWNISLNR